MCVPQRGIAFLLHWLLCGWGSPERASFTRSCPIWNRSSSGEKLRRSGAQTTPPCWKRSLNLISYCQYLERKPGCALSLYVITALRSIGTHPFALSLSGCGTRKANTLNIYREPWLKYDYNHNVCIAVWTLQMSATRLQHDPPTFLPLCICWQVWALLALSHKLDSGYFPDCLLRKVLAHPRVFCSWLWLMGKLLRIIVRLSQPTLSPPCCCCVRGCWEGETH